MSNFSPESIAKEIVEAILKPSSNEEELANLRKIASGMNVDDWKARQIALVTSSGALAGSMGGPWGMAAMVADLVWLGKNAGGHGCLGVGYALGKVDNGVSKMLMFREHRLRCHSATSSDFAALFDPSNS